MFELKRRSQTIGRNFGRYIVRRSKQLARLCLRAALMLIVLLVLFYTEENIRGHLAWSRMEKQLRAKEEPLTIKELIPPSVPDDQNFAKTELFKGMFDYKMVPDEFFGSTAQYPDGQWPRYQWSDRRSEEIINSIPRGHWAENRTFENELQTANFTNLLRDVYLRLNPEARANADERIDKLERAYKIASARTGRTDLPTAEEAYPERAYPMEERISIMQDSIVALAPDFEKIAEALQLPSSRFPIHYNEGIRAMIPHVTLLNQFNALIARKAALNIITQNSDGAFANLQALDSLRRMLRGDPASSFGLRRRAHEIFFATTIWEGTQRHIWNKAQLESIREMLREDNWIAEWVHASRSERAYALRALDDAGKGDIYIGLSDSGPQDRWKKALIRALPTGWLLLSKCDVAAYYQTALIDAANSSSLLIDLQSTEGMVIIQELKDSRSPRRALITANVLPEIAMGMTFRDGGLEDAHRRFLIQGASAQNTTVLASTACALELHFLEHSSYPDLLDQLVPKFIDDVPLGQIDRKPLRYAKINDRSYRLYSVGPDLEDNGGQIVKDWSNQGGEDWVWAVGVPRESER